MKAYQKGSTLGIAFATLMRALMDGEHTRKQLADITGLHTATVCKYVHWLHHKRVIYITNWTKQAVHGEPVPYFALNVDNDDDMPRPNPKSRQSVYADFRKREQSKRLFAALARPLPADA